MSRTDVHRPYNVQMADPYNRHLVVWDQGKPWYLLTRTCGCRMCTDHHYRRWERRRDRHRAQRANRELMKQVQHEMAEVLVQ